MFQQENIFVRCFKVDVVWYLYYMEVVVEVYYSVMDKKVWLLQDYFDFIFLLLLIGIWMEDVCEIGSFVYWVCSLIGCVQFVDVFCNMCFDIFGVELFVDMVIEVGLYVVFFGFI